MNFKNLNFNWLYRLGRVLIFIYVIMVIPVSILLSSDVSWDGNTVLSEIFLYTALFIFIGYAILIIFIKTLLYIFKGTNFLSADFKKKHYFILLTPIFIFIILSSLFYLTIEPTQARKSFLEAASQYKDTRDLAVECKENEIQKYVLREKRKCDIMYQQVKNNYDLCRITKNHDYCITMNAYEEYNCSSDHFQKKASDKALLMKLQTRKMVSPHDAMYGLNQCFRDIISNNKIIANYMYKYADLHEIYHIIRETPLTPFSLYIYVLVQNGDLDNVAYKQNFNLNKFTELIQKEYEKRK
jgi:hypothetical protein